ncbi:MAG: class C sortase [Finegoldia magna]|nr:class C sortase [Finegoldia magna]
MWKKIKHNFVFILIFLLGFGVMMYPVISRLYYRVDSTNQVKEFDKAVKGLSKEELDKRLALAKGYNDSLNNVVSKDPYDKKNQEEGRKAYARMLEVKEKIGHVKIPKINQDLPIYAGTSEDVLQIGIGHLEGTSLPIGGNNTHAVLTAHSGLPTAKLFTDLKMMKIGDKFYVHNIFGTLAYQVDQIKIVEPSNFNDLLIVKGHDYCTLLTCTPYMINSHRLLVRAERTEYNPAAVEKDLVSQVTGKYKIYLIISLIIIAILLWYYIRQRRRKKNNEIK